MPSTHIIGKKQPLSDIMQKERLSEWEEVLIGKSIFEFPPNNLSLTPQKPFIWLSNWLKKLRKLIFKSLPGDLTWTTKSPLNRPRWGLTAFTINQKIWVVGGLYEDGSIADIEVYDPATNAWTIIPNPFSSYGQAFVAVDNNKIYAVGGLSSCTELNTIVEEYNIDTNTLTRKANLIFSCYLPGIAVGANGKIYVMGGCIPPAGLVGVADCLDTLQEYDPVTNYWDVKQPLPIPRFLLCAIRGTDGNIYAMGGRTVGSKMINRVDVYNPTMNLWYQKAPMPNLRDCFAAVHADNGKIYAIAGLSNVWPKNVEEFDYVNNTWTERGQFPRDDSTRWYLGAAAIGNKIYAIGGYESSYSNPNTRTINTVEEGT
jgi:N-acetylneuraminic acid mutarotase